MRTFIAIELSRGIQDKLNALEDKLNFGSPDVKWVKPENIHLTLKFLGETDEKKLGPIKEALNKSAQRFKVFTLEISHLGAFPSLGSPRVIWVGTDNNNSILEMVKILDEELEKFGFPKEKRDFQPHLTLGRARSPKNINILKDSLGKNSDFNAGILEVRHISLIESRLTPSGPIYTTLDNIGLS